MQWIESRSLVTRSAIAAAIGAALGLGASWRIAAESGIPLGDADPVPKALLGAFGGAWIAIVLHVMRPWRTRSRVGHYLAWVVAVTSAVALGVLPDLRSTDARDLVGFVAIFGPGAGLALGLVARQLGGHRW